MTDAAFHSFADMAAFSPNSKATTAVDNAFSSSAFDMAFASEPPFATTTTTTTKTASTSDDVVFGADFDPHAVYPAFDAVGAFGTTQAETTVWDKTPLTDVPSVETVHLVLQPPRTVLAQHFHGTPVANPATGSILFCSSNNGVVMLHEVDPSRNFLPVASTPVLTSDLRHKMARKYSATVVSVDRVWSLACGLVHGAQLRTRVAAVIDLRVLESPSPVRIVAVWQWSHLQTLQHVLTPPSGGDYCYDLTTLQVAEELCFLAGASPKGACVFISQPAVREAWSANFLTGTPGTVSAMSVAPHHPYLIVALTDSSVTVWTFQSALQKDTNSSKAAAAATTKRWLFPLCRLQHAEAMAAEKPAVLVPPQSDSSSTAGIDGA